MINKSRNAVGNIHFAIGKCSLDFVLVAVSDRGLCALFFGDDQKKLIKELQLRFPNAMLTKDDKNTSRALTQIIQLVENPRKKIDLVLDERGTSFQLQVWKMLREIPLGSTTTYSDVAAKMGRPRAVRAVATACGANPISIITPCHRVVNKQRGLSGYRWGVERKQKLLQLEKAID